MLLLRPEVDGAARAGDTDGVTIRSGLCNEERTLVPFCCGTDDGGITLAVGDTVLPADVVLFVVAGDSVLDADLLVVAGVIIMLRH